MTRDTTIIHLANVLAIAEADGALSEKEQGALCEVMLRIGANEADLEAARDKMERDAPYRLRSLPDPADNMRMVENMVLVALADDHVSPDESGPLEAFLSGLGFVQADMDLIVKRVRVRLRSIPALPLQSPPPSSRRRDETEAGERSNRKSRFADPVAPVSASRQAGQQGLPKPKPGPPPLPVTRGTVRPQLPTRAQAMPTHAPPRPAATATPPEPENAVAPVHHAEDALTPVQRCAQKREGSPDGACYCFGRPEGPLNPWGCRLVEMAWSDEASWLRLGHFRDNDTFVFDREAIADRLRQRLRTVADCPFLLPGFAQAALAAMPSRATTAGRWHHHLASQTLLTVSAIPVTIRTYRHGCDQRVVARSDGLAPTDDRDARLMIRRTVRQQRAPVDLALLDGRQGGKS